MFSESTTIINLFYRTLKFSIYTYLLTFLSCGSNNNENPTTYKNDSISINISKDSIVIDTVLSNQHEAIVDTLWMGPFLMVNYNDVAILKEGEQFGDTLSLSECVDWAKYYLNSDTLFSIGHNGIQVQNFTNAIVKNPYGDCNRQIVLELTHPELRGVLAGSYFTKFDTIKFFNHQKKGELYFENNTLENSFCDSIFGICEDSVKYDSHSFFVTNKNDFVIEKRGNSTRMYNEGLDEEHFLYLNDEYRIAYQENEVWVVSPWTNCLKNVNAPEPIMSFFGKEEILIVWGYSEGMGDYQLYVSRIDLSAGTPSFENGKKMQGYMGLGCD